MQKLSGVNKKWQLWVSQSGASRPVVGPVFSWIIIGHMRGIWIDTMTVTFTSEIESTGTFYPPRTQTEGRWWGPGKEVEPGIPWEDIDEGKKEK
jgi:hypothetical protein